MEKKDYRYYTVKDFALDEDFQQWALHPNLQSSHFWKTWIYENPDKAETVNVATTLIKSIGFESYKLSESDKGKLWDAITEKMNEEEEYPLLSKHRNKWRALWKYAAAILLIAGLGIWYALNHRVVTTVSFSANTHYGEIKKIWLPDSSEVILNANSQLVYTENNDGLREAWIKGEAYFKVKHLRDYSGFMVHTYDKISVSVLGTVFNVNDFGKKLKVVLKQGSVKLSVPAGGNNDKTEVYLRPGEMLSYDKENGDYTKTEINTKQPLAWTDGKLVMDNYSLEDVALFMRQMFGEEMVISNRKLLQYHISGSLPISYNVDTMLLEFQQLFNVNIRLSGKELIVYSK